MFKVHRGVIAIVFAAFACHVGAQQKPPVKLGVISILSGPLATYGKSQELLAKMAVEEYTIRDRRPRSYGGPVWKGRVAPEKA